MTSFYAAPQVPEDARRLWDASCVSAGFDRELSLPINATRGSGASLLLAREWEAADMEARLADAIEASYEPTWDHGRGEFTWGLGLDEPHPRGQFNGFLAAAEACGPGSWTQLSTAPLEPCPQVVDVDFPEVALTRAEWTQGELHLRLAPLVEDASAHTTFQIVGATQGPWDVVSAAQGTTVEPGPTAVTVSTPRVHADLRLRPSDV